MSFDDHVREGRRLSAEEIERLLQSIATDARFCAVVGWLEAMQRRFVEEGCRQPLSREHGPLAHCQGSVYALSLALAQLRATLSAADATAGGIPEP
jgi:hypothetical protein